MPFPEGERPQPDYRTYLDAYDRAWRAAQDKLTEQNLGTLLTGREMLFHELLKPGKFELGLVAATPGVTTVIEESGHIAAEFLLRHKQGDWGELDPEDHQTNEYALRHDQRLLSAYHTRTREKLWIITEWDRSATTLLLPEEY